ncbi:MAG TPA: alpha/beta hydrolase [Candidatus Methylacidiphilales bacterium]
MKINKNVSDSVVQIPVGTCHLGGDLHLLPQTSRLVLFADGTGNSRKSRSNSYAARVFQAYGCGTLLFDLLTPEEEEEDETTISFRFDIGFLTRRLIEVTQWVQEQPWLEKRSIGYFGSGTGLAAALVAAATLGSQIGAVVSRSGRPDFATPFLNQVQAPTLFIVGSKDENILRWNEQALRQLTCRKDLIIVHGANPLFEEKGAFQEVAREAGEWFHEYLASPTFDASTSLHLVR